MKIALGADHHGVNAVNALRPYLEGQDHSVIVTGLCDQESCDYPDSAFLVGRAVAGGNADRGVLLCGSGIGMAMAANKIEGIRAALVCSEAGARLSRAHNNANVICLSADTLTDQQIARFIDIWLATPFEGGRHARRVNKISMIERGEDPTKVRAESCATR